MTDFSDLILYLNERHSEGDVRYYADKPLSECSTFHIGGNAGLAVYPQSINALCSLLKYLDEKKIRFFVAGNASNLLFSDDGYDGVVIFTTALKGISIEKDIMTVECGTPLSLAAIEAMKAGLSGFEFAYGIPGTAGGAVFMNAGAYGGEISQILIYSEAYDIDEHRIVRLDAAMHDFAYRGSIYMKKRLIMLKAAFQLKVGDKSEIDNEMRRLMNLRIQKQPLEYPSAGSVFKRIDGYYTAKLIDEAGLKGRIIGGAQVSEKHAGFIINRGGATAADVLELIGIIKETIRQKYSLNIECEIRYMK